jgi:hypothetical protein
MQEQTVRINIKDTTSVVCDECQNDVFIPAFILRKTSKFLTGSPTDTLHPFQVLACNKCGHVNLDMLPEELQSLKQSENE